MRKKAVLILTTISIACVARVLACYTIKIASWLSLINHVMSCQSNWWWHVMKLNFFQIGNLGKFVGTTKKWCFFVLIDRSHHKIMSKSYYKYKKKKKKTLFFILWKYLKIVHVNNYIHSLPNHNRKRLPNGIPWGHHTCNLF